jgi:hypothetical protein
VSPSSRYKAHSSLCESSPRLITACDISCSLAKKCVSCCCQRAYGWMPESIHNTEESRLHSILTLYLAGATFVRSILVKFTLKIQGWRAPASVDMKPRDVKHVM